jgi:hypothetical protein
MKTFEIGAFSYNRRTRTLVTEASNLGLGSVPAVFEIFNATTGNTRSFRLAGTDTDGEDTYGWRYESVNGVKALIIND